VQSLIHDYEADRQDLRKAAQLARTDAERTALRRHHGANPAFYAGGLLYLGDAARAHLDGLRRLGIGQPASQIIGVDLAGKPMKLSDYRGKVVALYFCGRGQLDSAVGGPAPITVEVREVTRRFEGRPFALLGVATDGGDRAAFQGALEASGLPARFWWDPGQDGKPGPIQTAWNARIDLYVLDRHGVIRYKHVVRRELFEKAVATLFKEFLEERKRGKTSRD
jgi:peroxiredoxin